MFLFFNVFKEKMFTNEIEDGREGPLKQSVYKYTNIKECVCGQPCCVRFLSVSPHHASYIGKYKNLRCVGVVKLTLVNIRIWDVWGL